MAARLRTLVYATLAALAGVAAGATPAGAQQLIDATEEGGEAFVAFTIMVVIFAFTLFYMDRVRRRRSGEDEREE